MKSYPMLSSDGHLEVLPERWTGRMPAKYRALAPRTTTLSDGSDAIVMEGAGPFKVNYIDLRGGRKAEEWQPVGVKVAETPGIGPLFPTLNVTGQIHGLRWSACSLVCRGTRHTRSWRGT